jgi:hypothetical protein
MVVKSPGLRTDVVLWDCPGLLFPALDASPLDASPLDASPLDASRPVGGGRENGGGVGAGSDAASRAMLNLDGARHQMEVGGVLPVAQVREPFTAVRWAYERAGLDLARMYNLGGLRERLGMERDEPWSPYNVCDALAAKNGWFLSRGGRADVHRAGLAVLRDLVDGVLPWRLTPPLDEAAGRGGSVPNIVSEKAPRPGAPRGDGTVVGQGRRSDRVAASEAERAGREASDDDRDPSAEHAAQRSRTGGGGGFEALMDSSDDEDGASESE